MFRGGTTQIQEIQIQKLSRMFRERINEKVSRMFRRGTTEKNQEIES